MNPSCPHCKSRTNILRHNYRAGTITYRCQNQACGKAHTPNGCGRGGHNRIDDGLTRSQRHRKKKKEQG
jgi:hypothetical protein